MALEGQIGSSRHRRLADSDSDFRDDGGIVLTAARASELCPVPHRLLARNNQLCALEDLSRLSSLDYIDLSCNKLHSLEGLNQLRLKTLNVSSNDLTDLSAIYKCETLQILNVSKNNLASLDWLLQCKFSRHLKVLVATNNSLTLVDALRCLQDVETLVLSHNEIEDLSPIAGLQNMVKVSASGNRVRNFNWVKNLFNLKELRLTKNRIDRIPDARLAKLKIADLGQNLLCNVQELANIMPYVTSLNITGNKFENEEDARKIIRNTCMEVEILDGIRLKGGSRKVRVNRIRKRAGLEVEADRNYARLPTDEQLERIKDEDGGLANDVKRFKEQKERTMKERRKEEDEEKEEQNTVEQVEEAENNENQDRKNEAGASTQKAQAKKNRRKRLSAQKIRARRRTRRSYGKEQGGDWKKRKLLDNEESPENRKVVESISDVGTSTEKKEISRAGAEPADKEDMSPAKKRRRKERNRDSDKLKVDEDAPPPDKKGQRSYAHDIESRAADDDAMDASEFVRIARRANVEASTQHKHMSSAKKKKNGGRRGTKGLIHKRIKPASLGDGGSSQW